jgi:hypothetical protein
MLGVFIGFHFRRPTREVVPDMLNFRVRLVHRDLPLKYREQALRSLHRGQLLACSPSFGARHFQLRLIPSQFAGCRDGVIH